MMVMGVVVYSAVFTNAFISCVPPSLSDHTSFSLFPTSSYAFTRPLLCHSATLPPTSLYPVLPLQWEAIPGDLIWLHLYCPADPPNVNCTISTYFDALGQSQEFPTVYNDTALVQRVAGRRRHLLSNHGSLAAAHRALFQVGECLFFDWKSSSKTAGKLSNIIKSL